MSNRFKDHIRTKEAEAKINSKQYAETTKYLRKISVDAYGSVPKDIFSDDDISVVREFVVVMAKKHFPGAVKLKLESRRPPKTLNSKELKSGSYDYRYIYKLANLISWKKIWVGQGYPIGILTEHSTIFPDIDNTSIVYLCSDMRIRCERNQPIFKSKQSCAAGVGTIPAKDKLKYVFSSGFFIDSNDEPSRKIFEEQNISDLLTYVIDTHVLKDSI